MHPDPEALPELASGKASTLLVSIIDDNWHGDASISRDRRALKLSSWLETVIALLQQGCDWEVYSYILVYLPSQLTNQALFRGAIPQIKQLRNLYQHGRGDGWPDSGAALHAFTWRRGFQCSG